MLVAGDLRVGSRVLDLHGGLPPLDVHVPVAGHPEVHFPEREGTAFDKNILVRNL